jgi:hypothetical protein
VPGGLSDAGFRLVRAVALRDIHEICWSCGRNWAGRGLRTNGIWATHDSTPVLRYPFPHQRMADLHVMLGSESHTLTRNGLRRIRLMRQFVSDLSQ